MIAVATRPTIEPVDSLPVQNLRALACFLTFAVLPVAGEELSVEELGELPPGYSWYQNEEMRAAHPLPAGWHVKLDAHDGTRALFITPEDIAAGGSFQTGFTLNYIEHFSKVEPTGPTSYAASFILQTQKSKKEVMKPWVQKLGDGITGMGIRVRDARKPPVLVHHYLIADDAEDSLRVAIFEAPEARWEEAWKHGAVLMELSRYWR